MTCLSAKALKAHIKVTAAFMFVQKGLNKQVYTQGHPIWNCMQLDTGFAWWLNANVREGTYVPPHVWVSPWRQMRIKECGYPSFCSGGRGLTCIALWSHVTTSVDSHPLSQPITVGAAVNPMAAF